MKKKLVALMLTMGMVLGLAACGGGGSSSDQSGGNASSGSEDGGDLPVLKVAVMPFLNCLPVQYMIENGLDEENGFKIETVYFANGTAMNEALAAPVSGWYMGDMGQVLAAEERSGTTDDSSGSTSTVSETITTKIQAEDAVLSLPLGDNVGTDFVKKTEANSDGGAHIKTSAIGAAVTLTFEGTGIRFYTKLGNQAGQLSVQIDDGEAETIDEYTSGAAQFKSKLYENLELSETNESHTIVLTTLDGDRTNFNFDYFEVISLDAEVPVEEPDVPETPDTTIEVTTNIQAENTEYVTLDPGIGSDMANSFVVENESKSNGGAHIKTSKIGATVTLTFEGTGVRFFTKKGNGAGLLSVTLDGQEKGTIDGYINSNTAQFQEMLFEALNLSDVNEEHTLVLTTMSGARSNFNFDYFEVILDDVNNISFAPGDKERSGIRVEAYGGGTYEHIYIKDCNIFDVRGYNGQDSIWDVVPEGGGTTFYGSRTTHRTGGINIVSHTMRDLTNAASSSTAGDVIDEQPTIFNDVLIEGNTVENCYANGITTTNVRGALDERENRHTKVVIRNNVIRNVQRAGIIPLYTSGCLVEYNLVDTFQQTTQGYGCGIWCDRANDMIFQYNEVCNGKNTMDGMAFNLDDMTENGIIQYNYSHNNVGGGVMLHIRTNSYNRNNTVRYNLSVNDTANYAAIRRLSCVSARVSIQRYRTQEYITTHLSTIMQCILYTRETKSCSRIIFFTSRIQEWNPEMTLMI